MLTQLPVSEYKYGLQTFLEFCEKLFGPNGQPIILPFSNEKKTKLSKDSKEILQFIELSSNNPLVKTVINFALEQSEIYNDHCLYVIIIALNVYFKLSVENVTSTQIIQELNEIESFINIQMSRQNGFHNIFETNFEFLVQFSISLINTKLFGFSNSKIESFSKFVIAALIQSMPDLSSMNESNWIEPKVLIFSIIDIDSYNYGEIYEGLLFPIENNDKIKKYLQRVIELRSFNTYEMLYKEKKKINSILINYDYQKFVENVCDQLILNEKNSLSFLKNSVVEIMENNFINVLDKANIGILLSQNQLSWSIKTKLSNLSIFVVDSINKDSIIHASRVFNAEVITSLNIEDAEPYMFQIEIPTFKIFHNYSYLAIKQSGIIILILYVMLNTFLNEDEKLASFLFKIISKLIFEFNVTNKESKKMRMLCHGSGCTEMLLAGMILRVGDNDRSSSSFWLSKNTHVHNTVKQSMANSLIKIWQLIHNIGDSQKLFNEVCGPLNFCRNNLSCVCGGTMTLFGARTNEIFDVTEIKYNAISRAIKLLNILLKTDSIILI